MKRTGIILTVCAGILSGMAIMGQSKHAAADETQSKKIRIGIYDNRAIAIAWASSKYNPVGEKMEEMKKAEADGDTKKAEELKAWGKSHQRKLHRQGFGRVPVDDLLAPVKDRLPEVAKRVGVVAIVWQSDFVGENVEVIDVSGELVKLFDPSEKVLRWTNPEDLKKNPPLDLEFIETHQDDM
ncbi:MAG: hypothetical protein GX455_02750 [Phycisphaerae bacterium]|nr:hypothetical protein [Phycisphaerae bacterium]